MAMKQKTSARLRAENHARNHVNAVAGSDLGRIFHDLKENHAPCELICLETCDFEPESGEISRNRAIKERLHKAYPIREYSTFLTKGLSDVQSGGWAPASMRTIFLDLLDADDLAGTVYIVGETLEAILAARARDIISHLPDLYLAAHGNDLFIMEQNALWLLQFSRHGKFTFARAG